MAHATRTRIPIGRRFMIRLLRSRFSGLVDRSVMLITYRGRLTGTEYTVPVQYAEAGVDIWVLPGHHERKSWWRNLRHEAPVTLWLRSRAETATATAFSGFDDPAVVEEGLRAYLDRFPKLATRLHVESPGGSIDESRLFALAKRSVIVRIEPSRIREA